jgi:O-methyltransferase involved in polyketide biosynthesis
VSALDVTWMDAVDPSSGVFIVAQGLLMYLELEAVHRLYACIADRATSTIIAMGLLALSAQDAAMAPLRQTVAANAERLGR